MTRTLNKVKQQTDKIKVFVGMSGGVDSSVAALLLQKQGYDVVGVYMKNWSETVDSATGVCTWLQDKRDAIRVCALLNIPFLLVDFEAEYRAKVIDPLFDAYAHGLTPNPDIMCNRQIKFDLFLKHSKSLGAQYIATGHYAKKTFQHGKYALEIPKDTHKDQTYFLYTLSQEQLSQTLFPLEQLTKPEVRKLAAKHHLPIAEKPDSQGICFVGQMPIASFLRQRLSDKPGDVLDIDGKRIGRHDGVHLYTLGQRHGFRIDTPEVKREVHYVVQKNIEKNILVVAAKKQYPQFWSQQVTLKDCHWISGQEPQFPVRWSVRVRHGQSLQPARITWISSENGNKNVTVHFKTPQSGVALGQSVVCYKNHHVLGGGVISSI